MIDRKINKIILHCTATKEGKRYDVNDIRQWHLDRGWSDIGYHYLINLNGDIENGRDIEKIGAHCKGQNTGSVGIAYVGGLDTNGKPKDTRTKAQKESLEVVIDVIRNLVGEDIPVFGHNEFSNKACPCFDVSKEGY